MGRTDDPKERYLFFKIQSVGTRYVRTFREAFPETPWAFVYRDPVQVMMSHLDKPHADKANCVRPRFDPPDSVSDLVAGSGRTVRDLTDEEYCAAHLVSFGQ